jgi:hypothetical protein
VKEHVLIIFLFVACIILGYLCGRESGIKQTLNGAIKSGVAEYRVDANGEMQIIWVKDSPKN